MPFFIAHDVGTSGVKSIVIDHKGQVLAHAIEPYGLQQPRPGWVEQEPMDYWNAVCKVTKSMMQENKVDPAQIKGIVFTTQAMGIIPVSADGEVLHPNISWVDGRAEEEAAKVMRKFLGKRVFKGVVGIEITGKDVIPKLMWIRDNLPEVYAKTEKFLDVNGFLRFQCTGKKLAEWSGACSYAFDLKKKDWERIFYRIAGIDLDKLPDLIRSIDQAGDLTEAAAEAMGLIPGIAVYGGCDDTQSAMMGSGAIAEGEAHIYLGTAAQVTIATRRNPKFKNGVVCLQSADPEKNLIVGVTEAAGVNVEWLLRSFYAPLSENQTEADRFRIFEEEVASVKPGAEYLIFTPWFLGERCPVGTTTTRSTLYNLSHEHGRPHIARALCEGVAHNIRWTLDNMEQDFGFRVDSFRVIGGGSSNTTWMQILAEVTGRRVIRTNHPRHAGAIGGAMCAMVGSGALDSFDRINDLVKPVETFNPNPELQSLYQGLFEDYQRVYKALKKPYIASNQERFNL